MHNHDLEAFEHSERHPIPPHSRLAIDEERRLIERIPNGRGFRRCDGSILHEAHTNNYLPRSLVEFLDRAVASTLGAADLALAILTGLRPILRKEPAMLTGYAHAIAFDLLGSRDRLR